MNEFYVLIPDENTKVSHFYYKLAAAYVHIIKVTKGKVSCMISFDSNEVFNEVINILILFPSYLNICISFGSWC